MPAFLMSLHSNEYTLIPCEENSRTESESKRKHISDQIMRLTMMGLYDKPLTKHIDFYPQFNYMVITLPYVIKLCRC